MSLRQSINMLLLYLFAFLLLGFGAYGLVQENGATKVTDPHAIIFAVGLLLLPFFPRVFAAAVKQVGTSIAEAWKAHNA